MHDDPNKSLVEAVMVWFEYYGEFLMAIPGELAVSTKGGLTQDAGIKAKIISTKTKVEPIL